MITRRSENARTLAAMLRITEERASQLLDVSILITVDRADRAALECSEFFEKMSSRTVSNVVRSLPADFQSIEVVFGGAQARTSDFIRVAVSSTHIEIGRAVRMRPFGETHRLVLLLTACYAAARCLRSVLKDSLPIVGPSSTSDFVILLDSIFGEDRRWMSQPISTGVAYLAGAGAIGNGFMSAITLLDLRGQLNVVDPDVVSDGNLNRCLWFMAEDVGLYKAEVLVARSQPLLPNLRLVAHCKPLAECRPEFDHHWLKTLIVAVDSRGARRKLENEFPREVFDASTTNISEIVLHHHRQPTAKACLGCIYYDTSDEAAHRKHVAESLGVSLHDVESLSVSEEAAAKICKQYPSLRETDLVGKAYDSLFKALCAEAALKTPAQRQVFAPFAFVSVFAGVFLAIEVGRRLSGDTSLGHYNYWRVSPWAPPVADLKQLRSTSELCDTCGNEILRQERSRLWSDTE